MIDIEITVNQQGMVRAQRLDPRGTSSEVAVGYRGVDRDVLHFLEKVLAGGFLSWSDRDIQMFGSLLFRCLIPEKVHSWLRATLDGRRRDPVRIALGFPSDGPFARMAAVPWEYTFVPGTLGFLLATDPDVILYRRIPGLPAPAKYEAIDRLRLLVVVNDPDRAELGEVDAARMVREIKQLGRVLGFEVAIERNRTADQLHAAIRSAPPHVVQLIGHAQFDDRDSEPSVAMVQGGGYEWVSDRRLAETLTRGVTPPRLVVLHACEGGRARFDAGIAGLAPALVKSGVQCVVGMQYRISNLDATAFSSALFQALAQGMTPDRATQEARWRMSTFGDIHRDPDPRLVGLPALYLRDTRPLLDIHSSDVGSADG